LVATLGASRVTISELGRVVIIAGFSAMSMGLGAAIATMADGYPRHRKMMETVGGILLIAGLALLGGALGCAIGRP
jgi:hypothetical protein